MSTVVEYNCTTGVQTVREETAEEAAQREADAVAAAEAAAAFEAAEEKKAADRESGNAKLKELGLTDDEISALVD
jgi:hypothetical protein|tara:strand:- start:3346 stop:3570 length:225 start_codon:yes stop_codon:yes gene_type:complete